MKTIVLHLAHDPDRHRRMAVAMDLAARLGAHVIGLYTRPAVGTPAPVVGRGASAAFVREMERSAKENEQDVRAEFEAATAQAGPAAWVHRDGDPLAALAAASLTSDLLVVSQTPPATVEDMLTGHAPDHAALTAACPVLIVPHGDGPARTGRTVLVAWKRTREASRTVRDALPILRSATRVAVLSVSGSDARDESAPELIAYLGRHGIDAELKCDYGSDDEVGPVILAHARDSGADMLVMGAYGHSRLRELILGGVTQHCLAEASLPVLMSH